MATPASTTAVAPKLKAQSKNLELSAVVDRMLPKRGRGDPDRVAAERPIR